MWCTESVIFHQLNYTKYFKDNIWRPWQSTEGDSQVPEHQEMDASHFEMWASDHPRTKCEPVEIDTELHSSNQHQSMDKLIKQPELDCEITITTIADFDIETVEMALVQVVPETE